MELWTVFVVCIAFFFGRSMLIWGFLTYTFGWWILLPLCIFGVNKRAWKRRVWYSEKLKQWNEDHLVNRQSKPFETVDDLFKQLENK